MAKKPTTNNGRGRKQPKETAAYFLSLSLENVRCFGEKQTLDLSDGEGRPAQWTILLGNNGTGKTTVLQALAVFEHRGAKDDGASWHSRIREAWLRDSDPQLYRGEDEWSVLKAEIARGSELRGAIRHYSCTIRQHIAVSTAAPGHARPPTCYGYGASRRIGASLISDPETADATASLFSDRVELRNAEEWLLRLDYAASKRSEVQQQQKERLGQVKELLIKILPEVDDIRFTTPTAEYPTPRVEFKTPYGWVPLRQLGYGYQTLIGWMVDFASRMVERYPDSPDPLAEPAVVLVDEIDLHLHPTWQRQLIGYLTERFPNTQFIATAHSPLIVQAASRANLAVLRREGDQVVIDNDVEMIKGWRIDQVLTSDLFGLESARPPELDELLKKRNALLEKPKLTKTDKEELTRLEAQIGPLPGGETAEQAKALSLIEKTLNMLDKPQK